MHLQVVGAQSHAFGAVKRHGSQIRRIQAVFLDGGQTGGVDRLGIVGELHVENLRRVPQPRRVVLQPEDRRALRRLVGADPFEDAQAVVQRVGQDMDLGVTPRHHFSIQPNHTITVGHRHREFSLLLRALNRGAYYTADPANSPPIAPAPCRPARCLIAP